MKTGIVIKNISNFFYVYSERKILECKARGNLNSGLGGIIAGDRVKISSNLDTDGTAIIEYVLERHNQLYRPLIANVNLAILVVSVKEPPLNSFIIDSFLVSLEKESIDCLICFSKIDLDSEKNYERLMENYRAIGYETLEISIKNKINIELIKEKINNKVSIVCGPSGSGKSSLINCLSNKFSQKTGSISQKLQKGKNTTTHTSLLKINEDSFVADSPGFTSFKIKDIKKEELKQFFVEFEKFENECKFKASCLHDKEPGCGVKKAVEMDLISKNRYLSYLRMLEEIVAYKKY